jgi:peptide/nickel transport system permease protein
MPPVAAYVGRRLLRALPIILAAVVLNFLLIHLAPGDPARTLAGESGSANPEFVEQLRRDFGLDRPLGEQLLVYLGKVLRGDIGYSFRERRPVASLILERAPATLLLMGTAFAWALAAGIAVGTVAARRARTWLGSVLSVLSLIAYAMPAFWFGLMLIVVFAVNLQVLPTYGMATIGSDERGIAYAADVGRHLILPALTLGVFYFALYTRLTRASMLETLSQEFVVVARAKGLSERRILFAHALRNAVLAVATVAGIQLGQILGGSVLIETIFAWPGTGRLLFEAMLQRDYPVLLGILLFSSFAVVGMNIVTDFAYGVLDPRTRRT